MLRISSQNAAIFEPNSILIGGPNGDQDSCEDVIFLLKGFRSSIVSGYIKGDRAQQA